MSIKIGPAEALWSQVTKMQLEAAEEAAKNGIKKLAAAGGALPPPNPPKDINKNIIKKIPSYIDLACNKITESGLGKNLNKYV